MVLGNEERRVGFGRQEGVKAEVVCGFGVKRGSGEESGGGEGFRHEGTQIAAYNGGLIRDGDRRRCGFR